MPRQGSILLPQPLSVLPQLLQLPLPALLVSLHSSGTRWLAEWEGIAQEAE